MRDDTLLYASIDRIIRDHPEGTVVVFPDDPFVARYVATLPVGAVDEKNIRVYPRRLTPVRRARQYVDMYRADAKIIIGTRALLTTPLADYPRIVYIEDALATHLFTHFHRVPYRMILDALAMEAGHTLFIVSTVPSVRGLFRAFREGWTVRM